MMNQSTIDIFSWVLLIPATLLASILVIVLTIELNILGLFSSASGCYSSIFSFSIIGIVTPITWISVSYFLAPSHKKIILWLSLFLGITTILIFAVPTITSTGILFSCGMIGLIMVTAISIISGTLTTFYFQRKTRTYHDNLSVK